MRGSSSVAVRDASQLALARSNQLAGLACEASVHWKEALRMLHHMRSFSRGLDYHGCQNATISSAAPRVVLVMQPWASCYNTLDTVPHAIFGCLGLVVVCKPPGWEVGTQDIGKASGLCIWL